MNLRVFSTAAKVQSRTRLMIRTGSTSSGVVVFSEDLIEICRYQDSGNKPERERTVDETFVLKARMRVYPTEAFQKYNARWKRHSSTQVYYGYSIKIETPNPHAISKRRRGVKVN